MATSERTFGADSTPVLWAIDTEAIDATTEGRLDDALTHAKESFRLARLHYGDGGTRVIGSRIMLARIQLLRGELEETARLLDDVFSRSQTDGTFLSMAAELQAATAAIRGVVDPKITKRLAAVETTSPFTKQIIALVLPLVDGRAADEALTAVDDALEGVEDAMLNAIGALVRGHLMARLGRHAEAAKAFAEAGACGCTENFGRGVMQAAALGRVASLRHLDDPALETAYAEARDRLAAARADHPSLAALGPAP